MLTIFYGENRNEVIKAYRKALGEGTTPITFESNLEEIASHKSMFGENFVLLEQELAPELKDRLEKLGAKLCEFKFSKQEKLEKEKLEKGLQSRIYKFSDTLLARDRRALWIGYHRALSQGFEPEELYWKLAWQVKNILIAHKSNTATEADQHPFVYAKSKQASQKFSQSELINLSSGLLDLWRDAHNGKKELPLALEQFILTI